ncbi:MAG: hypothetical protein LRZ85_00715 [Alphaproteobacteria bacterium]|nr:hypothetical protein [Alphaproteobacteria bacterium]MCD8525965.1 hypothetical protein [Alphaproteobacteria bacterium]MCD8570903.1 hypothetical protein [Alphaproteobacteria bacterium]
MAPNDMTTSSPRLLLNAEPFGFGPAAAIAGFFPHLRPHFDAIGYVGKRHTLDLQRSLTYDAIHDVSEMGKEERAEVLAPIFAQYDVFLSAMDHKMVELAKKAGLKVFYYDALTWYWPEIPASVRTADLYMGQNFFGVEERLHEIFREKSHAHAVSPIVSKVKPTQNKQHILINLGGLQNPFWPVEEITAFASKIIDAIKSAPPQEEKIIIASSCAISECLKDRGVKTYSRAEMETLLAESKLAFMTPGLGNIYDAAAYNIPTIWLPPANDSQGQQLKLLQQNVMCDQALDWHDFMNGDSVNYKAVQTDVLKTIAALAKTLVTDDDIQNRLGKVITQKYETLKDRHDSQTQALIKRFGTGGEKQVADLVTQYSRITPLEDGPAG